MERIVQTEEQLCRTMRVDECAKELGIGRAAAYAMVNNAVLNNGEPFKVIKIGHNLLISRKSFFAYLDSIGF